MRLSTQILSTVAVAALAGVPTAAMPLKTADTRCTAPTKRVSWHDLHADDRKSYLAALQCVMQTPAKLKLPGAKTRWDELVSLHQIHALQIHSTGQFLPFHRYYLHVHEFLLKECGYGGGVPYWDEPRDAGNFTASEVLDPVTGFGGGGTGEEACVPNGPFVNFTVNIGPGFETQPRCVNRRIQNGMGKLLGKTQVDAALKYTDYGSVWNAIYAGPHLAGHGAFGMMNGDAITSPGDPIFFLHHGFIDKLWWDWQAMDLEKRLTEINGPNAQDPSIGFSEFPGDMAQEAKIFGEPTAEMKALAPDPQAGDQGNVTTLDHVLSSLGIIPDTTIGEIMDIGGKYLCYSYE